MIDVTQLKEHNKRLLADLIESRPDWETEEQKLDAIRAMSPSEALDAFLTWNGIIGYTSTIIDAVHALQVTYSKRN